MKRSIIISICCLIAIIFGYLLGAVSYRTGVNEGYNKATDAFNIIHHAKDSIAVSDAYDRGYIDGQHAIKNNY